MKVHLDLLDQIHNLRDHLGLLNLAARSLEIDHERNAMERGTMMTKDLLDEIAIVVRDDLVDNHSPDLTIADEIAKLEAKLKERRKALEGSA